LEGEEETHGHTSKDTVDASTGVDEEDLNTHIGELGTRFIFLLGDPVKILPVKN
jgi:hypothetical protein